MADKKYLSYSELRRWIAILSDAERDYRTDGNAARRFFDHDITDLLIDIGRYLPPNERRPDALSRDDSARVATFAAHLRGDGECGGAPQPA